MFILNKFFYIVKRFIFSMLVIYAYNVIIFPVGGIIPINIFTIFLIMIFGFPAIVGFSIFSLLI